MNSLKFGKQLLAKMISAKELDLAWNSITGDQWTQIVSLAQMEEVAPLLYWALTKSGRLKGLPKTVSDLLRAVYYSTRMKNEQNIRELDLLMGSFNQAGIPVAALKGMSLALTVYPDIGLRPMIDVDLLVPAAKMAAAVQIVKSAGYTDTELEPEALPGIIHLLGGEVSLKKTEMPFTMLELHNSLLSDTSFTYSVPVDRFWERIEPFGVPPAGKNLDQLFILSPCDQLLYLAAHAMLKHGSSNTSLRWLYDLDLLIRYYSERLDWDMIFEQAKSFQWASALRAALEQTCIYFDTPVPEYFLSQLRENEDRHRELVLAKGAVSSTRVLEERQSLMERKWYGKVIVLLGLLFPSPAYMRWRYRFENDRALPAWYLRRWWGILKDAVRTISVILLKGKPAEPQAAEVTPK